MKAALAWPALLVIVDWCFGVSFVSLPHGKKLRAICLAHRAGACADVAWMLSDEEGGDAAGDSTNLHINRRYAEVLVATTHSPLYG